MRRTSMGFLSRDALATQISVAGWVVNDCFVVVYEFGADGLPGAVFHPGAGVTGHGVVVGVDGIDGVGEVAFESGGA